MASLYIVEQGATLRKESNRLVVERDGAALAEIHDFKLDRVVIFGNVQLTTPAIWFLLESGIDTAFLSASGKLRGRLAPLESKNVPLRLRQYECTQDAGFARRMASAIVAGKIANCIAVLSRHQRNHPECALEAEIAQLNSYLKKAARGESAHSLDSLRGVEGQAAAVYFQGFARTLRRRMQFTKRTRRPPADPVNALLSFGYTLLYNEAISALSSVGFDPYLGFYHALHYGRCSLALDLMEEMRPLVADRLATQMVNLEIVKPDDFRREQSGVLLGDGARKRFFREYERIVNAEFAHRQTGVRTTLRRALHDQAQALQRALMQGEAYRAFQGWN